MVTFKRGDTIGFGSREHGINGMHFGKVTKVSDDDIMCLTTLDGGLYEESFKQLKSGRWIKRDERGDDPKNRLHLRHVTGKQLAEANYLINLLFDEADWAVPQAVKRVRVAA